jgi:LysM repeat protein
MLDVSAFALTSGQWDPAGTPAIGQQVASGTTGCWRSLTTQMSTPVAGSLTWLVAQDGHLVVQWDLDLTQSFQPTLTPQNWTAADVGTALVVNPGDFANVWIQVLLSTVVTVGRGQTLDTIAADTGSDRGVLMALNGLTDTALVRGQRLLVTGSFPLNGLSPTAYVIRGP